MALHVENTETVAKRVTIRDVATRAGVSIATVSRVVNNVSTVNQALARRVNEAIEETGYIPNDSGRTLRRQQAKLVAVVVPNFQDQYYRDLIDSVEKRVEAEGYHLVIFNSRESLQQERTHLRAVLQLNVAGLLLASVGASENGNLLELNRLGRLSTVLLDRPSTRVLPWIGTDNAQVGGLISDFLQTKGVQKPLVISARTPDSPEDERADAFWLAWTRSRRHEIAVDYTSQAAHSDLAKKLKDSAGGTDAVICTNESVTRAAYVALYSGNTPLVRALRGDRQGLIFLGFDDSEWCSMVRPSVSTIRQDVQTIGDNAAKLLIALIREPHQRKLVGGENRSERFGTSIPTSIVERETTLQPMVG